MTTELENLLAGHAGRALSPDEERRLRTLAAQDPAAGERLRGFDEVLALLDRERALRDEVLAGAPGEELHPQVAAAAEEALRERRPRPTPAGPIPTGPTPARWWPLAAALVLGLGLWWWLSRPAAPDLRPGPTPGDRLGPDTLAPLVVDPVLDRRDPVLTWRPVPGAARYDARITGADGQVLLRGTGLEAPSWRLTDEQVAALGTHPEPELRVTAFDALGNAVARSDAHPLRRR